jgi:hypothetical protein
VQHRGNARKIRHQRQCARAHCFLPFTAGVLCSRASTHSQPVRCRLLPCQGVVGTGQTSNTTLSSISRRQSPVHAALMALSHWSLVTLTLRTLTPPAAKEIGRRTLHGRMVCVRTAYGVARTPYGRAPQPHCVMRCLLPCPRLRLQLGDPLLDLRFPCSLKRRRAG